MAVTVFPLIMDRGKIHTGIVGEVRFRKSVTTYSSIQILEKERKH